MGCGEVLGHEDGTPGNRTGSLVERHPGLERWLVTTPLFQNTKVQFLECMSGCSWLLLCSLVIHNSALK